MRAPPARVLAPVGLTGLVLATRLPGLDRPRSLVFDEVYYALDAAELLRHGVEPAPAHPPLGKWLIAGGIRIAGFTPTGWRLAGVLAGVALVLVTWLAARVLTDDPWLAFTAGALVALDGIAFVTGRLALLDGFLAVTTTAAAWCLLAALRDRGDPDRLRRWRWATAVLLGIGVAIKWSAAWTWPVAAVVLVALERRAAEGGRPRRRVTARSLLVLTLVPAALYVGSYAVWFGQAERTRSGLEHCDQQQPCRLGALDRVEVWVDHQRSLLEFHTGLEPDNPYVAPAWTWLVQTEPANLFDKPCLPSMADPPPDLDDHVCTDTDDETHARMLVVANPVSWVVGLVALGALVVSLVGALRGRKAAERSGAAPPTGGIGEAGGTEAEPSDIAGVLLALTAAQWLPWAVSGREVYSYYAITLVPLLALAVVAALDRHRSWLPWAVPTLLVGSAAAFLWLYPLLAGLPLDDGAAGMRLLLPGWSS
jgi:dolichyl-phosphate-mannose-protein mannosyltransferase